MTYIRKKVAEKQSIASFFGNYRKHMNEGTKSERGELQKVRIAILTSSTIKGIQEVLFEKCFAEGIEAEIWIGGYNQYRQEILSEGSELYKFHPDLIFINIHLKSLLGEYYYDPYSLTERDRREWVSNTMGEVSGLVSFLKNHSSAKIILHNFQVPDYSPMGILENKQPFGLIKSIKLLNMDMEEVYQSDNQVFVFDFDRFSSQLGKFNIRDEKMYYLGDIQIAMQYIPDLCEEYLGYIKPLLSRSKKCIVLDLDNTLWGGIIGEDGIAGLKLGQTPEGKPFVEFQKYLLALFGRGILLAVNSKNNVDDAMEGIEKHPEMVLREKHFAAMQINWDNKAENIIRIAKELNIGVESVVFIDDDELNCEMVHESLPEVLVVCLPEDPAQYVRRLQSISDFNTFQFTQEDVERGKMYSEQRQRSIYEKTATSIEDYLRGLEMEMTIEEMNEFNVSRIAQLTHKTNQFNVTTRRYSEEELINMQNRGALIISARVADKFGDNGIVGVAIINRGASTWMLDTFLLSCRVIGRKVETALLSLITEKAKVSGVKKVEGEFIPTSKNRPSHSLFEDHGFELIEEFENYEKWVHYLEIPILAPAFIKTVFLEKPEGGKLNDAN